MHNDLGTKRAQAAAENISLEIGEAAYRGFKPI